ncbi:tyrosine-protein phosphatase [Geobacter argillaceus]|uniref:protein-tyrosine-phosphatase n=1 Tax=Geobacter argillaceus TaxID=345631 RepID=A0A562VMK7_9BACT|nr:CpsB/CapC family capsule biosynthesis tyrosine phosphatase [Geobacter argillaceus]TWJ18967.1 protein-tyrosine phosphatase [Geobacter argillaceus]
MPAHDARFNRQLCAVRGKVLLGFTDYHSHILPALDDGARDVQESLRMAAILAAAGFQTVHCTPHRLVGAFEATPAQVAVQVAALQRSVDAAGIPVQLLPGMEYYLDEFLLYNLKTPLPLGNSSLLLIEAPLQAIPPALERSLRQVKDTGFTPLIAHPERCQVFFTNDGVKPAAGLNLRQTLSDLLPGRGARPVSIQPNVSLLERITEMGCRFQADIGSFAGKFGGEVQRRALTLLDKGIYTNLGSDAHRSTELAETLQRGLQVIEETVGKKALVKLLK